MERYLMFDDSEEKQEFVEGMGKNLKSVLADIRKNIKSLEWDRPREITFRGHHIRHPILRFMYDHPEFSKFLSGKAKDTVNLRRHAVLYAKEHSQGILQSFLSIDYLDDIVGGSRDEIHRFIKQAAGIYLNLFLLPPETKVTLTANIKLDEVCNACIHGGHCKLQGDSSSKLMDAIFVHQLTQEVGDKAQIISSEMITFGGKGVEYITESTMTLATFREGLLAYYPRKKHIFEPSE